MRAAGRDPAGPGPEEPKLGFRLPRSSRVHRSREIRELLKRGERRRTSHLDVFFAASPASHPRLGLIVPKHRHRIVDRNLLKRRLREIVRLDMLPRLRRAGISMDVLVRARKGAYDAAFPDLKAELVHVTEALCSSRSS